VINCTDSALGSLKIIGVNPVSESGKSAKAANQEFVRIQNISKEPISLDGYYLQYRDGSFPFEVDTTLAPRKILTVRMGRGQPTDRVQYWGRNAPLLKNSSGTISLLSERNVPISSKSW